MANPRQAIFLTAIPYRKIQNVQDYYNPMRKNVNGRQLRLF